MFRGLGFRVVGEGGVCLALALVGVHGAQRASKPPHAGPPGIL